MVIGEAAEPVRRSVHPDNAERVGEPDDAVLVAAAREHPQAFAALYDRYVDRVFAYCFRRLSHPETAADATSQVFTNAIQAFPGFRIDRRRAGSSFRSWLFSIAHNVVVDHYRSARALSRPESDLRDLPDNNALPEDHVLASEVRARLHVALGALPDKERAIVELRLAGLKRAEIAEVLGLTDAAVRSAQTRAFERLRGLLADPEEHPHARA